MHDLPVESIILNFGLKVVRLCCAVYSDEEDCYKPKEFIFTEVKKLNVESMILLNLEHIEIYSAENISLPDSNKMILTFLAGFGQPTFNLDFEYKEFRVQ